MRFTVRVALAAVLTAGFVAPVDAQDRPRQRPGQGQRQPGGFGGGMGFGGQMNAYSMVANNTVLQEELSVTEEQRDKLREVLRPIQERQREARGGFTPGQRPSEEQLREMRERAEKLAAETKAAVEGVLKPEQAKRLRQINYQLQGVAAFTNKEVQEELKLTDDQKERIKTVVDEYNRDRREVMMAGFQRGGGQDREELQKRMQENRRKVEALAREAEEKVTEKLTDEQKAKWKDLQGEKFDTSRLTQGFQRRQRDN